MFKDNTMSDNVEEVIFVHDLRDKITTIPQQNILGPICGEKKVGSKHAQAQPKSAQE